MKIEAMKVPSVLVDALNVAADSLSKTFNTIGLLNGDDDAPIPERNLVIHVAAGLLSKGFSVYAEPRLSHEDSTIKRIDLLAFNENINLSIAFEAKTFGTREFRRIYKDQSRLEKYQPQPASFIDGRCPSAFWNNSDRWGVIMVLSFAGSDFSQTWKKQTRDKNEFDDSLRQYKGRPVTPKKTGMDDWREFAKALRDKHADVGVVEIFNGNTWKGTNRLDLLWAAFPLPKPTP